jgi:hypothetical protein
MLRKDNTLNTEMQASLVARGRTLLALVRVLLEE